MTSRSHPPEERAGREGGPAVTTRQARAALLFLAVLVALVFALARRDREAADPAPLAPPIAEGPPPVEAPAPEALPRGPRPTRRFSVDETAFDDVASGLAVADEALAAGRVFAPPEDNALKHYRGVLALDPDNEAAQEGLAMVQTLVAAALEAALARRDVDEAAALVDLFRRAEGDPALVEPAAQRLERMQRAGDFLAAARTDLEAGRLIDPVGSNALSRWLRARDLDADHPSLAPVFDALEDAVVGAALQAGRRQAFDRALRLIDSVLATGRPSRRLAAAREELLAAQAARVEQLATVAEARMAEADFAAAERMLEELRQLGAREERLAELRAALGHARLYGRFEAGEVFRDTLPAGQEGPAMIVLPHGSFLMGSSATEEGHGASEAPRHRVFFARGFALARHEVTVGQFELFVRSTGYRTDAENDGYSFVYNPANGRIIRRTGTGWRRDYAGGRAEAGLPVLHVSWNDAAAYARWLARAAEAPYRLPSEAEFEYALRAGSQSTYWWGEDAPSAPIENLTGDEDRAPRSRRAWNRAFSGYGDGFWGPAPAASLATNAFGLYDMAGNVTEWVADCWHDSYVRAPIDGSAWVNRGCPRRVARGGFWGGDPATARSAYRTEFLAEQRGSSIGFRVARDLY